MMKSFEDANKFSKEMMDHSLKSYAAMTKGVQTIASEATDYSKKSYEDSVAVFEKLSASKSLENAMQVQSDYMKSAYESLVAQTTKMGDLYADLAKEVYKPFETAVASATK